MPPSAPEALERDADVEIDAAAVRCVGAWTVGSIATLEGRLSRLAWPSDRELVIDASGVVAMDTAGAWLLRRTMQALEREGRTVRVEGLRSEHRALADLLATPAVAAAVAGQPATPGWLARLGRAAVQTVTQSLEMLSFVGEASLVALRSIARPARIRWRPILYNVRTAGFDALPISGLLCFLMGIVIAYQGATQLRRYGANIFVADLVGLAMLRELSPLLTAIIVAGRSGSAYAAQIGTMKVTEEVDALRTVGIAPIELLVLPKIAALAIALPLLTVYADVLGVAGGMVMAKTELDVGYEDFLDRLQYALRLSDFLVGIGKAPVFAAIIALVGCFQGFQVVGDAESVGHRTTVSVVQSIFLVIVADAAFSVVFNAIGI
ncbi:MAG: MlaE family lipid ABC transporter permease subunit [Deltaproteobacteria bacterium]|nr:MlaE family lipid ABC transporter permease subunit [Deltaproteobacteria bacterium]